VLETDLKKQFQDADSRLSSLLMKLLTQEDVLSVFARHLHSYQKHDKFVEQLFLLFFNDLPHP